MKSRMKAFLTGLCLTVVLPGLSLAQGDCEPGGFGELSKEKLAVVASNICAMDTILEMEQVPFSKNQGGAFVHDFKVEESEEAFTLSGRCTKEVTFDRSSTSRGHALKLVITKQEFEHNKNPFFIGKLGAVAIKIQFKDNSFYDPACATGARAVRNRQLAEIKVGLSLFDIVKRGRTLLAGYNVEQTWNDRHGSPVKMDFRAAQFNARQNRLISSVDRYGNVLVKVGQYLFKEEGAREFTYEYENANHIFLDATGGFQGCSVIKNDSELSIPAMISASDCSNILNGIY